MKPSTRLALLLPLVTALAFVLSAPARADHSTGHDHLLCGQGGGNASSGGEGGTIPVDDQFAGETNNGEDLGNTPILIPTHLGERFGLEDPVAERNGDQFIEAFADQIDDAGTGSSGSAFHGGHGGGPNGGQGGSTFLGGGDGGCGPTFLEAGRRVPRNGLPVTGSLSDQLALLGGLMLSLGWLMWLVARRSGGQLAPAAELVAPEVTEVTPVRRGFEVVSRLKQQMKGTWASGRG